jgi:predicted small lipoprotein YifL
MLRQFLSAAIVALLIGLAACSLKPPSASSAAAAPPAVLIALAEQRTVPVFGGVVARTDSPASVDMPAPGSARTR